MTWKRAVRVAIVWTCTVVAGAIAVAWVASGWYRIGVEERVAVSSQSRRSGAAPTWSGGVAWGRFCWDSMPLRPEEMGGLSWLRLDVNRMPDPRANWDWNFEFSTFPLNYGTMRAWYVP